MTQKVLLYRITSFEYGILLAGVRFDRHAQRCLPVLVMIAVNEKDRSSQKTLEI